jgi:hypothetical protein
MSQREKKLLIIAAVVIALLGCFWVVNFYQKKTISIKAEKRNLQDEVALSEGLLKVKEQISDEMNWLQAHEPKAESGEQVPARLQEFCATEASNASMTIKSQKILPNIEDSPRYHRAIVDFTITGKEQMLYQWFDRIHSPDDFRVINSITMTPNREDDTQIDCAVAVEQWYVPIK